MNITWYGHAAFGLEGRNARGERVRIITDPYNYPACGGYLPIDEEADIVSVSHENPRYHSDLSSIRGVPEVLRGLEYAGASREARGVRFEAFEVFENERGEGPNAIVKLELGGLVIAHLGDLGHPLGGDGLEFLGGTDVLLALAGGPPTISIDDLKAVVLAVRPALVFPMHYRTPKVNLDILPIEDFLRVFADFPVVRPGAAEYEVTKASLPGEPTAVVLEHAR